MDAQLWFETPLTYKVQVIFSSLRLLSLQFVSIYIISPILTVLDLAAIDRFTGAVASTVNVLTAELPVALHKTYHDELAEDKLALNEVIVPLSVVLLVDCNVPLTYKLQLCVVQLLEYKVKLKLWLPEPIVALSAGALSSIESRYGSKV